MHRDAFLKVLTTDPASALTGLFLNAGKRSDSYLDSDLLENHTINSGAYSSVQLNYPRLAGKNAQLDIHGFGPDIDVGIIRTDQGAAGLGMIQAKGDERTESAEYIQGKIVSELFIPAAGITDPRAHTFDIVIHDLAGKILDEPVCQLLNA